MLIILIAHKSFYVTFPVFVREPNNGRNVEWEGMFKLPFLRRLMVF